MDQRKDGARMMNWAEYEEEERRNERFHIRRIVTAIIVGVLLAGAAVLFAGKARADDEVRVSDGSFAYVRHQSPCDDADILMHLTKMGAGERLAEFKKGTLTYEGRIWRSCWIEVGGAVYSVDEAGEPLQPLKASAFKEKPSA